MADTERTHSTARNVGRRGISRPQRLVFLGDHNKLSRNFRKDGIFMNRTIIYFASLLLIIFLSDNPLKAEGDNTVTIRLERSKPDPDDVNFLWPSMDLSDHKMVSLEPAEELKGIPEDFPVQFFGGYRLSSPGTPPGGTIPDDTVSFLTGQLKTGEYVFLFDTDNDENFSDEKIFQGLAFSFGEDTGGYKGVAEVAFEYVQNGRVRSRNVDIEVYRFTNYRKRTSKHPIPKFRGKVRELLTGKVQLGGIQMRLGFHAEGEYATYDSETSTLILDTNGDGILDNGYRSIEVYKASKPFSINGTPYRVERVSPDGSTLTLAVHDVAVEERRDLELGKPAPSFTAADLSGSEISLQSFRNQLVLLDFWATSCGPCISHIPALSGLWRDYADKGFVIIGVSADTSRDKVLQFTQDNQMGWHHVVDTQPERRISRTYNVNAIPAYFLIDQNGLLIAKYASASQLRDLVASHLTK